MAGSSVALRRGARNIGKGFPFDLMLAGACLLTGIAGIRMVADPAVWREIAPETAKRSEVGAVYGPAGAARVKRKGSTAWIDVPKSLRVSEGDVVYTAEGAAAALVLDSGEELRLGSSSLVVVHVEKPTEASKQPGPWWTRIASTVAETVVAPPKSAAPKAVVEVRSGSVQVVKAAPKASGAPAKTASTPVVRIARPKESGAVDSLTRSLMKSVAINPKKLEEKKRIERVIASGAAVPLPSPRVVAPIHGARIGLDGKPRSLVQLRWQGAGPGLVPEVVVGRVGTKNSEQRPPASPAGASIALPAGEYAWRVRFVDSDGKKSPWSEIFRFGVVDQIDRHEPVAALKNADGKVDRTRDVLAERKRLREEALRAEEQARIRAREEQARAVREKALREERERREAIARREAEIKRREREAEAKRAALIAAQARKKAEAAAVQSRASAQNLLQAKPVDLARIVSERSIASAKAEGTTALKAGSDLDRLVVPLEWQPVPGAKAYEVALFEGNKKIRSESLSKPTYSVTVESMSAASSLGYQIAVLLGNGSKVEGPRQGIKIEMAPPTPVSPGSGATVASGNALLFSWARTVLTEKYGFQLSRDPKFSQLVTHETKAENFMVHRPLPPGKYYWRLKGYSGSKSSAWSSPVGFEIPGATRTPSSK